MPDGPHQLRMQLPLQQARDLTKCYGHHRAQSVKYALNYCLHCRKLKSCVRATWATTRNQRWQRADWWMDEVSHKSEASTSEPRTKRKPVNIS